MKKVMCFAVHPDDETLAFGGTLLKHKDLGDEIYWVIITNINERDGWDREFVFNRQKEIEKVSNSYGFKEVFKLDFASTKLDSYSIKDLISPISSIINKIKPELIYLPNRTDIHTEHQIAFKAIYSCTKNFRYPFIKRILMGETLSETEFSPALPENVFIPNVFVDITDHFKKKIDIMNIYSSEIMQSNYPRSFSSIEALAKYRGSSIGVNYAESFMLLKEIL